MDSLTQIVLGAAVSEALLGKKIGNRALLYGGLIGTIPDLDIFVGYFYDPITALEVHRGFSHSLVFFLLFSPILGLLLKSLEKKSGIGFYRFTLAAFLCLATHALLDAFTTWGTQLFWPHPYRAGIQSIFVIDPLYTLPFLICLILVMRRDRLDPKRKFWNKLGLLVSSSYLLLTVAVKFAVTQEFESALQKQGIAYERLLVKPAPLNIILWNANIATTQGYFLADYSFFDSQPISFKFYPNGKQHLQSIANQKVVLQLISISEGWYLISKRGDRKYFNDLRFGMLNEKDFAFSYELISKNGKVSAVEVDNKSRREGIVLLKKLLKRIAGN